VKDYDVKIFFDEERAFILKTAATHYLGCSMPTLNNRIALNPQWETVNRGKKAYVSIPLMEITAMGMMETLEQEHQREAENPDAPIKEITPSNKEFKTLKQDLYTYKTQFETLKDAIETLKDTVKRQENEIKRREEEIERTNNQLRNAHDKLQQIQVAKKEPDLETALNTFKETLKTELKAELKPAPWWRFWQS
jgi:predicted  nucleic acid-binding Zn-ribbon protein